MGVWVIKAKGMNKLTGKGKPSMMRNVLSLLAGGAIGLYFGQYFPDLYWKEVDQYVIELDKGDGKENEESAWTPKRPRFDPGNVRTTSDSSTYETRK